jgi:arylsulfatase A-like enzyme
MLEDTWMLVTSDHGDFTGEKGLFNKCETLYACQLHVPLIVRPPDSVRAPRGLVVDDLVELVDVFPTALEMAGAEVPGHAQGRNLLRAAEGKDQPPRNSVLAQVGDYHGHLKTTFPTGMPEHGRRAGLVQAARDRDYVYIRDPDYGDEAYDRRRDPWELDNLLNPGKPTPPARVDALRRRVDEWAATCLGLRERLGVVLGDRGFQDGWGE